MNSLTWAEAKVRIEVITPIITTVALVVGGIYGLVEYRDHQREQRLEKTFGYVERFSSPPISDMRLRLAAFWVEHDDAIVNALTTGSPNARAVAFHRVIMENIAEEKLEAEVEALLAYYEQVAQCTKLALCDSDTIDAMLKGYAAEFFHQFYPYVCDVRTRWRDDSMGAELELFANPGSAPNAACQ